MKFVLILLLIITSLLLTENQKRFDHTLFNDILQKYVIDGWVNYKGIKSEKTKLDSYLKKLEQVDAKEFELWPKENQMTFWINAYNAITIEGILVNYPIKYGGLIARMRFPKNSIRQIKNFWDTVFIKVMDREITLNNIEHDILRGQFQDPRIHFVLVCASIGCPLLENQAFTEFDLSQRLEKSTSDFINNTEKVLLNKEENKLFLSSIFDWYKEDFESTPQLPAELTTFPKEYRGVIAFILKYLPEDQRLFILNNKPKIDFFGYSWALNEKQ
jgi:hypothetical protein